MKTVDVMVSGKMLRQLFHACTSGFITGTCHGRCCEGSAGLSVAIHPTEQAKFEAKGAQVVGGLIVADGRGLCPFKTDDGFCGVHTDKPFGCAASPFTLNKNDLLIVRNRYRMLKCYNCPGSQPAYIAHRPSLDRIFGAIGAGIIARLVASGEDRIAASMPLEAYTILKENDRNRRTT